jgi:hypothetical protein
VFRVIAVAAELSGLDRWGAISAIVAGAIAAVLFLGAVLRWVWQRARRPNLIVMAGNSPDFNRRLAASTPDVQMVAAGAQETAGLIVAVHAKLLKVRETKGTIAKEVAVRVTEVDPIGPREHFLPVSLEWTTGEDTTDIQPHGQKEVVLQRVIVVGEDSKSGSFVVSPVVFENSPLQFTLEVLIDGKRYDELRFRLEHAWPSLYLYAESEKYPHDPFPYPKIKPVVRGRRLPRGGKPRWSCRP